MPRRFKKLDDDLPYSSINEESLEVKWAFVICMTLAHWKTGEFRVTPKKLAILCGEGVDEDQAERALLVLTSPDPRSSSPEMDGRRLEHLGNNDYRFVNWALYQGDMASIREAERKKEEYWKRKQEELEESGETRREAEKAEKAGGPSTSISISTSSSKSEMDRTGGSKGGKRKKKAAEVPEYSQMFEDFWAKSWKRGHKRAAWAWWSTTQDAGLVEDQNEAWRKVEGWTQAFERRPADKRPHVSTWLNNRGWEDDLAAETAKASNATARVGEHHPPEESERRLKLMKAAILEHAMHLMKLELEDPEAAEVVVKAVSDLEKLAGAKMAEMEKAHKFGEIHDAMLDGLVAAMPDGEVLRGNCEAKAEKHAVAGEPRERMAAAMLRKEVREHFSINDISDYDWEG